MRVLLNGTHILNRFARERKYWFDCGKEAKEVAWTIRAIDMCANIIREMIQSKVSNDVLYTLPAIEVLARQIYKANVSALTSLYRGEPGIAKRILETMNDKVVAYNKQAKGRIE